MNRTPMMVLGGIGAALALLVGIEWIAGEARLARIAAPAPAARREQHRAAAPGEIGPGEAELARWVDTALARPLLTASRRPAAAAADTGVALSGGLPRLAGTIVKADGGVAIFARDDNGHALVLREGGTMGPYRIIRINADSVTLDGPAGMQTVRPRFGDPKAASPPGALMPTPLTMPGMVPPMPGFPPQMPGLPQQQIDHDPG